MSNRPTETPGALNFRLSCPPEAAAPLRPHTMGMFTHGRSQFCRDNRRALKQTQITAQQDSSALEASSSSSLSLSILPFISQNMLAKLNLRKLSDADIWNDARNGRDREHKQLNKKKSTVFSTRTRHSRECNNNRTVSEY